MSENTKTPAQLAREYVLEHYRHSPLRTQAIIYDAMVRKFSAEQKGRNQ
jgi:hypothetical protein